MLQTIDTRLVFPHDNAAQSLLEVKPELALALHGVRMQLPDQPLLRRCFHSFVARFRAAHNWYYYIAKYQGKAMEQLQKLFAQIVPGLRRLQLGCHLIKNLGIE